MCAQGDKVRLFCEGRTEVNNWAMEKNGHTIALRLGVPGSILQSRSWACCQLQTLGNDPISSLNFFLPCSTFFSAHSSIPLLTPKKEKQENQLEINRKIKSPSASSNICNPQPFLHLPIICFHLVLNNRMQQSKLRLDEEMQKGESGGGRGVSVWKRVLVDRTSILGEGG